MPLSRVDKRKAEHSAAPAEAETKTEKRKKKKLAAAAESKNASVNEAEVAENGEFDDHAKERAAAAAAPQKAEGSVNFESKRSLIEANHLYAKTGTKPIPHVHVLEQEFSNGLLENGYVRVRKDGTYAAAEYKVAKQNGDGEAKYNRCKVYENIEDALKPFADKSRFHRLNQVRKVRIHGQTCYEMMLPMAPIITKADRERRCTILVNEDMLETMRKRHWEMRVRDVESVPYACCTHEVLECGVPRACAVQRLTTYLGLLRPRNGEDEYSWRDMRLTLDERSKSEYMNRAIKAQCEKISAGATEDSSSAYDNKIIMENLERRKKRAEERKKRASQEAAAAAAATKQQPRFEEMLKTLCESIQDKIAALNESIETKIGTLNEKIETKIAMLNEKIELIDDKIETAFSDIDEKTSAIQESVSPPASPLVEKKRKAPSSARTTTKMPRKKK